MFRLSLTLTSDVPLRVSPFPWQRIQDVRHLPLRYWLLILTIMFFYNGVFPFVADAR